MNHNGRLPNLAGDLVRIHKVITRGLEVGQTRGAEFINAGFPNQNVKQGFTDFIRSLVSVITAHHLGEDEIAFPVLKMRLPSVPYEQLSGIHNKIETILGPIRKSMTDVAGEVMREGLNVVVDGLRNVSSVWPPHIKVEETSFSERALAEVMIPDEQAEVSALLTKHAQEHSGPPFLILPFVLFNLAGEDRTDMAALFPMAVLEELIPNEWKEKWAPMKPFLLG